MKIILFILLLTLSVAGLAFEIEEELLTEVETEFGAAARLRLESWQALSERARDLSQEQQLEQVNRFFNQVPFVSDIEHWGEEDYWATPIELLATFAGDCEDYSIAKYLSLRSLGITEEQLRITYVKARELNQAHMVLAYYATPEAEPLILDNLINEIKPASQRPDLEPVYSFNGEGLWLTSLQRKDERRIGDASRLERWVELKRRIIDNYP